MLIILFTFVCLFSFGIYMLLANHFKLPSYKASKAVLSINKRQKKKVKNLDVFILELSTKSSKYIKINDYKKRKLIASLKLVEINLSPETYIARAYVKAGIVLLSIIPALIILQMISSVILVLTIGVYFKEVKSADEEYLMIDPSVPQSLVFLRNVEKRARKYEEGVVIISHSVVDFL